MQHNQSPQYNRYAKKDVSVTTILFKVKRKKSFGKFMYADYKKKEKKLRQCTGQEKKGLYMENSYIDKFTYWLYGGGGED